MISFNLTLLTLVLGPQRGDQSRPRSSHLARQLQSRLLLYLTFILICLTIPGTTSECNITTNGLHCNLTSTPTRISLNWTFPCDDFNQDNHQPARCNITLKTHDPTPLHAKAEKCYIYTCTTSFGFWGVYSESREVTRTLHRNGCEFLDEIPEDPYTCNYWWCKYNVKTERCLCLTENITVVALPNGHLYCSFEDCSMLSAQLKIQYTPTLTKVLILDNVTHTNATYANQPATIINGTRVMIHSLHKEYTIVNYTLNDTSIDGQCEAASSTRRRRDASQGYTIDSIGHLLYPGFEACRLLRTLLPAIALQPLLDHTLLLQAWFKNDSIAGRIVSDTALVWTCERVDCQLKNLSSTSLYFPVQCNDKNFSLNPWTNVLYSDGPDVGPGRYLALKIANGSHITGVTGSGICPQVIEEPSMTTGIFSFTIPDLHEDLIQSVHILDPVFYALGMRRDFSATLHSSTNHETNTSETLWHIGLPSFSFLNPLGWIRDLTSWAAWLGGILYLVTIVIFLIRTLTRRVKYGR
ncbi:G [Southwest carpet python virus]|uniref:G n=1 Tax=Southwest carpet python virus TaxID=2016402 RepID=A0A2K8MTZ2_9MONO|nr:G [Southwest carpet python virus] [Southwest carpet python virus]ATY47619.1 G [Southwest carpet python virus] [Southwest carpet python virus]